MTPIALDPPLFKEVGKNPAVWFLTNRMTFLATPEETNYAYSLVHTVTQCNGTPPPHIHSREDEVFYMLRGHGKILVKDQAYDVHPGSLTFLPRGLAHSPIILSEDAEVLVLATPGEFVDFFRRQSIPATSTGVPTITQARMPMMDEILNLGREFGVTFLPPGAAVSAWPVPMVHAEPRHLPAGEGRQIDFHGGKVTTKLGGSDTQGLFSVFETEDPECSGPPATLLSRDQMSLYVLQGRYLITSGSESFNVGVGGFVHVPANTGISYESLANQTGRMLLIAAQPDLELVFQSGATRDKHVLVD